MEVSVIIPVYNAAAFVERAVFSALKLRETSEVILVEDGSTDNSLQKCKTLSTTHARVVLLRHPDGRNRGPAASRNLALKSVRFPYIAFLDADDYYLENRFVAAASVFERTPLADGVYGRAKYALEPGQERILPPAGIDGKVQPDELLEVLLKGERGWFSIDTLVVKQSLLQKTGLFDEHLRQTEDTDLIFRMILAGQLYPDEWNEPVAVISIHGGNTTLNQDLVQIERLKFFTKWYGLLWTYPLSGRIARLIVRYRLDSQVDVRFSRLPIILRKPAKVFMLIAWIIRNPGLVLKLIS